MDKALAWALVGGTVGLATMAAVASLVEPPLVAIADADDHVGSTVRVQGRVLSVKTYEGGYSRFLLGAENASIHAQADFEVDASAGDEAEAVGQVLSQNGHLSMQLATRTDFRVVRSWRDHHVPLGRILRSPWEFRDSNVLTSGILERVGIAFRLTDPASSARMAASGASLASWGPEALLLVGGRVEYEPDAAQFRLRVSEASLLEPGADDV